jgi:hypothetical protein
VGWAIHSDVGRWVGLSGDYRGRHGATDVMDGSTGARAAATAKLAPATGVVDAHTLSIKAGPLIDCDHPKTSRRLGLNLCEAAGLWANDRENLACWGIVTSP